VRVSQFSPADHELRRRWIAELHERMKRRACFPVGARGASKRLTRNHVAVLEELASYGRTSGATFPSVDELARATGLSRSLVQQALRMGRLMKMLDCEERWVTGPDGRPHQSSNSFVFLLPGAENRCTPYEVTKYPLPSESKQSLLSANRPKRALEGMVCGYVDNSNRPWHPQAPVRTPQQQIEAVLSG
jgi:hypothetical protein